MAAAAKNVYDTLTERGFIAQITDEEALRGVLGSRPVTFYIGFDPTADSLHVGHFLQMVAMAHMQRAGHKPIAIIGGGTAMVGDPSGKTDMRKMLTLQEIQHNADRFRAQLSKFIDFGNDKAIMINNADWLLKLNYVDFLREIGVHFSVNRMLAAECFKSRLEKGLSFIEFNYMLMQSYDFLMLFKKHGCTLQMGGDDQWSNILNGIDLVRRVEGKEVHGMTLNLLTTSDGRKMGKTESGAVWLDPAKTSPYDFYQYWRNVHDEDVVKCLKLLTFLPMDEIRRFENAAGTQVNDRQINEAKKTLAYEVTALVHGADEAAKAQKAAEAAFGSGSGASDISGIPTVGIDKDRLATGMTAVDAAVVSGICPTNSEARRLIVQGGLYINELRIDDPFTPITEEHFKSGGLVIRKGRKTYRRIILN